ncbi:MAG: hypothetical protein GY940_19925 [bacterium]|nr:hypothetical protein [bacterium]
MKRSTHHVLHYLFCVLLISGLLTLTAGCTADAIGDDNGSGNGSNQPIDNPVPPDTTDYNTLWKQVNQHFSKGLPKSALDVVGKIYQLAKKHQNAAQFIKALIHRMRFIQEVEEETFVKVQKELNDELKNSSFPIKPILHSILAEQYWNYYQNNRYRILRRTKTSSDFKQEDLRTWDAKRIVEAVMLHYGKSLENREKSKKVKIDAFNEILHQYTYTRKFRPTLYDFLVHRAIDFYRDSEAGLTKPRYQFTLNDDRYFSDTATFAKLKLETKDPLSFSFFALQYLQDLIRFHLDDENPSALVDAELKRLRLVYDKAVISNKEIIYEKVLRDLLDKYQKYPVTAEIYFELASLYDRLGNKYKPGGSEDFKWHKKKAHQLCREAIKKYPQSIGAQNCQNLIHRIETKTLHMTLEQVTVPRKPSRTLVQYKNIDKLYFKIVKTNRDEIAQKQRLRRKEMMAYFIGKDEIKKWDLALPDDKDYQGHSAEIKIDGLDLGMYMVLAATSPDFNFKEQAVAYSIFNVSNIAYISRKQIKTGWDFHLVHRSTGQPLPNAVVQVWYREYSRSQRRNVRQKGRRFNADGDGFVNISRDSLRKNYVFLEFIDGQDRLSPSRNFNFYRSSRSNYTQTRTVFFTDRAIYRPGQTVYFKGIMMQVDNKAGEKAKILPNYNSQVILYDVNSQKVSSLNLKTNDYGTYSGTFQLPVGRLNGNMRITDNYGNVYFRMEEYKRPKFKVSFKPLEKTYRLKDKIKVTGFAKAYAGYNIDNAEVKYRVVRNVFYPYPWYFRYRYGGYMPKSSPMEISNGITKTNAGGTFDVTFEAIPDLTVSKKFQPAFTYTVFADVTDLNGETRSAQKRVYIGYTALKLSINMGGQLDRNQKQYPVSFNTTNLGGDFVVAKGNIVIHKLKEPNRVFRHRLWQKPDKFTIAKKDYYINFPHDIYSDENSVHTWKKEKEVFSTDFDSGKSKKFTLTGLKRWKSGKYMVEMSSRDRFGSDVKTLNYFTIYSSAGNGMPFKTPNWFTVVKGSAEPGETAVLLIGSSQRNVRVLYEIEHRDKIIQKKYITINKQQKRIGIPILEKHRGNLGVHLTFIKNSRMYTHNQTITVPWSNKKLDISFETFRNKLLPGEKEEWRIKIKGPKGDQVAAEMVAALYDASLDAFKANYWNFSVFPNHYTHRNWESNNYFNVAGSQVIGRLHKYTGTVTKYYDRLNWFGFYWRSYRLARRQRPGSRMELRDSASPPVVAQAPLELEESAVERKKEGASKNKLLGVTGGLKKTKAKANGRKRDGDKAGEASAPGKTEEQAPVKVRTNFNETAFFYPHLKTSPEGEVIISFTVPEALTKWKMMGFAHTKKLEYGFAFNELVTQKELMVVPNAPRFFREGDSLVFTSKVTNLSEKALSGTAQLKLLDAVTMQPVDSRFKKQGTGKTFNVKKGQSALVSWKMEIPEDLDAVTYRITARAGKFSDGEEKAIPILKNRMLVTESMPLPVRANQTKSFKFKKLVDSSSSKTLRHKRLTLEFTSNPVWYAVQALPYLMEYPHECMEQTFSRFYGNSIASYIVNSNPRIKKVFDLWQNAVNTDSPNANALLSNLEKNQELKSVLLEETPWVLNGQNETQRKKRIALLFDLNSMAAQLGRALKKLKEGQMPSGAWPWFKGMRESRYITQHIVCGFAHLGALKVLDIRKDGSIWKMMKEAVPYLDRQIAEDYRRLIKHDVDLKKNNLGHIQVHYLYARSYFRDIPMHGNDKKAFEYYKGQVKKYWTDFNRNKYMQGMMSLIMKRYNETETAVAIAESIKEHALYSEEMGMYWKTSYGYYWYQMPIETHALLIEMFDEVLNDAKSVEGLKTWLLKQKQTQDWRTTKATAEACYALLLKGDQWLKENRPPEITLGKANPMTIIPGKLGPKDERIAAEAGTGYFKMAWSGKEVLPDMGNVTVKNNNNIVAWGSLYWQYFEQLDKITPARTPLHLEKKLFVERPSDTGPVLHPLTSSAKLNVGDRVKVRIELRVDRNMEYVHMKDMRASTMEPEQVLSGYRWQDGLGYYQTTKDASTNFFFDYLSKGTYVFEYPLRVTHEGDFSNGITSIQCMYAPEFTSHSEGVRVSVESKK